jgi:D-alanyl-D-alanine carboxypeptidase
MRFMVPVFALCLASASPSARSQPAPQADLSGIDEYVQSRMRKANVPGFSVAVVQDGKVILARGYGWANVELSVPATENTVYQIASVTKTFTATAIMMLVEEGKLKLDDRIAARLPGLPAAWKEVTVRQLLTHTSGIKSYTSVNDFRKTARKDYERSEILDLVAKDPLEFAPGEKWSYSNTGYFLLGLLIEKETAKTYGEFMADRIFKPLGMAHTRVNDLHAIIPNRAQGYTWDGKAMRNGEYVSPTQPFAAGMLVSTVSDLVKWDSAMGSEKLLKKSSLEQMWIPAPLGDGGPANYGFGWQISKVNGHRRLSHGGGIPGFASELSRFVDDKLTVIVLSNSDQCNVGSLAQGIARRILPSLIVKPREPIADHDPHTTERLKKVVLGGMNGEVDPELFTEDAKKAVVEAINKEGKNQLGTLGALKAFRLLEREALDKGMRLRYRAEFDKTSLELNFHLDESGKIAHFDGRSPDE